MYGGYGYNQPQQTGYPGQNYGQFPAQPRLNPQITGWAPGGGLQPQSTGMGYPVQPQATGMGYGGMMQQRPSYIAPAPSLPPAPPVPNLPPGDPAHMAAPPPPPPPQQQQNSYGQRLGPASAMYPQQTGFQPQYGVQLAPQQTGFAPQMTGYQQQPLRASPSYNQQGGFSVGVPMQMPSLFTSVFMPANPTMPTMPGQGMQFSAPAQLHGQSLQQTFQQANVQHHGQAELKVPWALSAEERKNYDQIFRAWDQQGAGFISGQMAREVFGQSGIERDDLMKIWNLADVENRGKLNLAEFHVAMGLIYRRINGNPIPEALPAELVPPSQRDLGGSVDFVKDLLRNDTVQRATGSPTTDRYSDVGNDEELNYRRAKSLHDPHRPGTSRKDATAYRHNDDEDPKTYKPSSRHIDRRNVRFRGSIDSSSDLEDMRRELDRSQGALDSGRARDDADDDLREEKEDLMHRIKQLQADIEYTSGGRRTEAKEAERRRLDRELDTLRYEKLPELERKMEAHKREADQKRREAARKRDARNNASRYDDGDRYSSSYGDDRRRSEDRSYRDDDGKDRYESDRQRSSRSEDDRRDRSRDRTPNRSRDRTPPPRPTSPPSRPLSHSNVSSLGKPPAPPTQAPLKAASPVPPRDPSPAPEQQKSLGAMTAEERKEYVRAEAAKRVQMAMAKFSTPLSSGSVHDTSLEERIEQDKRDAEARRNQADHEAAERERQRQVRLEEEKLRDIRRQEANLRDADSTLQKYSDAVTVATTQQPQSDPDAAEGIRSEVDKAAHQLHEQEVALQKEKAAREERIRRLQAEIEETKRLEEEQEANFRRNKEMFAAKTAPTPQTPRAPRTAAPAPPASRSFPKSASVVVTPAEPSDTSAVSIANTQSSAPALGSSPGSVSPSTNPFHRIQPTGSAANVTAGTNPFSRSQVNSAESAKSRPPAAPSEDWDVGSKASEASDASEDDEAPTSRTARAGLASALFGNIMPATSRPSSAQAAEPRASAASSSTPAPPPAPPVAPTRSAPRTTEEVSPSSEPARNALLSQIQSGKSLKKASTNDRSSSAVAGRVIGDIGLPPTPQSTAAYSPVRGETSRSRDEDVVTTRQESRSSVDWYGSMATESLQRDVQDEDESEPTIKAKPTNNCIPANVDMSSVIRVFSLYPYSNTAEADHVSFPEDVILEGHRATDNDDWMYGKVVNSGASGWFPAQYVQPYKAVLARAIYPYEAGSPIEMSLQEGHPYQVVDQSDSGWWKVERDGRVGNAPASYLEVEGTSDRQSYTAAASVALSTSLEDSGPDASSEDDTDPQCLSPTEQTERDAARQKVLEAAGLLVQNRQSLHPARRAPPPRPDNRSRAGSSASARSQTHQERPHIEVEAPEHSLETVYDRYVRLQRDTSLSVESTRLEPPPISASAEGDASLQTSKIEAQPTTGSWLSWIASGLSKSTPSPSAKSGGVSPIVVQRVSGYDTASSITLGRSWASSIEAGVLDALPTEERKRQEAIFELIQTEASYLHSLQQLVGTFFIALDPLLPARAAQVVISNVEQLISHNTAFLSELEQRQRDDKFLVDRIGDVILGFLTPENLNLYRIYCANQSNAAETINSLKRTDPEVAVVLQKTRVDRLELEHYLLQPMQRLTRYPLLLKQILHYTEEESADHADIVKAVAVAEGALVATNEAVRAQESEIKLQHLSANVVFPGSTMTINLLAPSRLMGQRMLLRDGQMVKTRSHKRLNAYLLTDLLLLTSSSGDNEYVYKEPMPLEDLVVRPGGDDLSFGLACRGHTEKVRVSSTRESLGWQRDIAAAQSAVLNKMKVSKDVFLV